MPNVTLFPQRGRAIVTLETVRITDWADDCHQYTVTTSREPAEEGVTITDHAIKHEEKVTLVGYVPNSNDGAKHYDSLSACSAFRPR